MFLFLLLYSFSYFTFSLYFLFLFILFFFFFLPTLSLYLVIDFSYTFSLRSFYAHSLLTFILLCNSILFPSIFVYHILFIGSFYHISCFLLLPLIFLLYFLTLLSHSNFPFKFLFDSLSNLLLYIHILLL